MANRMEELRRRGLRAFVIEFGMLGFAPLFMVGYVGVQILLHGSVTYTLGPFLLDTAVALGAGMLWALTLWWLVITRRGTGEMTSSR
jgi:hypothetical protein